MGSTLYYPQHLAIDLENQTVFFHRCERSSIQKDLPAKVQVYLCICTRYGQLTVLASIFVSQFSCLVSTNTEILPKNNLSKP